MGYEDPSALLGRLRLGREEFCQRLLTMLIVGGPYPRWNTESVATPQGWSFLEQLHHQSFGGDGLGERDDAAFIDEFDLPRRDETEPGGAPDYAVLTPERLWLIELKTERASHRHGQIPQYFDLAYHHHRHLTVDITYLTPTMASSYKPAVPPGPWGRFCHLTWDAVAVAIRAVWGDTRQAEERAVVDRLLVTIDDLEHVTASEWRAAIWPLPVPDEVPLPPLRFDSKSAVGQKSAGQWTEALPKPIRSRTASPCWQFGLSSMPLGGRGAAFVLSTHTLILTPRKG